MTPKKQKLLVVTGLILIIAVGFYIRIDSLSSWQDHKERFTFGEQRIPLMLTVDSYFYLELAKQLQDGTYSKVDLRRQVPAGYSQPATPPLLSVLLARISSISSASLERVALLLPAFLGILLAIPVYLLTSTLAMKAKGKFIQSHRQEWVPRVAGLAAALLALLSPMLAGRSSVGWCDTDTLNVTFPVLLAWLAIQFTDAERLRGQLTALVGFVVTSLLFLWWWDQSYQPVFAFILLPFAVACAFVAVRNPARLLPIGLCGLLFIIMVGYWKGFDLFNPFTYLAGVQHVTDYITAETGTSPFRAAGQAVSEQAGTSAAILVRESAGAWPGFLLSCSGVALLAWLVRGYILFLLPLIIVAALSVTGQRFLIFTAPLFGLGIGALCFVTCHLLKKMVWRVPVVVLLIFVSSWGAIQAAARYDKRAPRRSPVLFDAMLQQVNGKTEKDAVIWASWGHGHPLLYYGQRGTMADGMFHSAELQYVLNFPLAADSFQQAANWISFYVVNGSQGLRRANELFAGDQQEWAKGMAALQGILGLGAEKSRKLLREKYKLTVEDTEEKLQWLFPGNPRPVYLFLDYLLISQAWYTLGQWNLATRSAPRRLLILPVLGIGLDKQGKISGRSKLGKVTVDAKTGKLQSGRGATSLGILKLHDGKKVNTRRYESKQSLQATVFLPGRKGLVSGPKVAKTVLVKLYYEYTYNRRFFSPMDVTSPYYAIWKVTGEQYQRPFNQNY